MASIGGSIRRDRASIAVGVLLRHPLYILRGDRNGLKIISKSLARVAKKQAPNDVEGFTKAIMDNIETTTDASVLQTVHVAKRLTPPYRAVAVQKADLVIEAIIESLKVKRDLFKHLDGHAR